jgi:hypothetical protein
MASLNDSPFFCIRTIRLALYPKILPFGAVGPKVRDFHAPKHHFPDTPDPGPIARSLRSCSRVSTSTVGHGVLSWLPPRWARTSGTLQSPPAGPYPHPRPDPAGLLYPDSDLQADELNASILRATRLPRKPVDYGTIRQLFTELAGAFEEYLESLKACPDARTASRSRHPRSDSSVGCVSN